MTSTHTFLGLETDSKPSSRVLKPPGGGSSCIFGNAEEVAAPRRQQKASSNIFGSAPEQENAPRKSNPPGGKTSGLFRDPDPVQVAPRPKLPGGKGNDIFGEGQMPTSPKAHPNKPKDNITLKEPEVTKTATPVKADPPAPKPEEKTPVAKERVVVPDPALAAHEPHLGPRPRSHNRVLNPPGGKSSVTFY